MKIKLFFTIFTFMYLFTTGAYNAFAQTSMQKASNNSGSALDAKEQKKKAALEAEQMVNLRKASIYFPLLLQEDFSETSAAFQQAIDKFYATKTTRQAFLRTMIDDERFSGIKYEVNESGDTICFFDYNNISQLIKQPDLMRAFFDNHVFLGADGIEEENQTKTAEEPLLNLSSAYSLELARKNAKSLDAQSDEQKAKSIENNPKSKIVQSQIEFKNYAFFDEQFAFPVFADKSLFVETAGDYQKNLNRFILSTLAFISAYPSHPVGESITDMLYNRNWTGLYAKISALQQGIDENTFAKYLRVNQIQ